MERADRWALAVLDSLLHISCVPFVQFVFEAELMLWKPNRAKKHDVMSVFCGLSCMNVQKLECMHLP